MIENDFVFYVPAADFVLFRASKLLLRIYGDGKDRTHKDVLILLLAAAVKDQTI